MEALAAFARSDAGTNYAATCSRFGLDPAAFVDDPVLAYNLRYAFAASEVAADAPEDPDRPKMDERLAAIREAERMGLA